MLKANLTIDQVSETHPMFPKNGECKSGHLVDGGVKLFYVSGETLDRWRWGVYCENCIRAAFKLTNARKDHVNR